MASYERSNDLRREKEHGENAPTSSVGNGRMIRTRGARSHLPLITLAVLAILLHIGPAFSQTMPGCIPPAAMEVHVGKLVTDVREIRIEGQNAKSFVGAFNTWKTPTAFAGDLVLVFMSHQLPGVGVTIFDEGCLVAHATIEPVIFKKLLAQAGIADTDI
jgi:hypothetical protein